MAVEFKDYYQILGVPRQASEADIKKAFRKLARQYHPDVAKDKKNAEAKFKDINEAYEVLGNPENRRKYDELGANWKQGASFRPPPGWQSRTWSGRGAGRAPDFEFHFGGTGFSEFFEQFFGGGARFTDFGSGRRGSGRVDTETFAEEDLAPRGHDIEGDLLVTLEEALRGSIRSISVRHVNARSGASETRTFKVRIPPGVQEGRLIRLAGRGEESPGGGATGDLYLRVRLAAHPDFRVRGADLYYDLDLAPWEAVLGTTVEVPTLQGSVSLRIPPNTQAGQQLRIRGRGLPEKSSTETGNLYVLISIQLPEKTSSEEKALWEQLAKQSKFNPRKK